jgi:para-aminobenzoate synthetase/4-amino-4-deoxychorismate lyase
LPPSPTAIIDFPAPGGGRERLVFGAPRSVLMASSMPEVTTVLAAVQRHAEAGRWCVGFLRYEAAPAFDAALEVHPADGPLAWFGVHDAPVEAPHAPGPAPSPHWRGALERPAFDAAIDHVQRAIAAGAVYQVNLAGLLSAPFGGEPLAFFNALQRAQGGGWAAYVDAGAEQVLSVSPELFFDWNAGRLLCRPMKGTAPRGTTPEDDAAREQALRASAKERAENLMIVDLLRNDVSRIAEPGSVQVPQLFATQGLPSVWQMVSDVSARTRAGVSLADVFAALFPCGSVTGAPKVAAMRMIRAIEPGPRGVYCGAVGLVRPGGAATFNVPIRTVAVRAGRAVCGIGSGITADASAAGEWAEWTHKRAFVERASRPFELLETMRLEDGRHANENEHVQRMAGAAAHFGYPWREVDVRAALAALAAQHPHGVWRTRLRLDASGAAHAHAHALDEPASPLRVRLAQTALDEAHGEFVRFKTTHRAHYDRFAPQDAEVFDTLLWNAARELTEFTRGNVCVRIGGRWVTPPTSCGLLPGIERAKALREGRVVEAVVRLDDLVQADAMAFLNSLRGWLPVAWLPLPLAGERELSR